MRNSVLPIPWTHRDSCLLTQVEQDRIENFDAHRRLGLPPVRYSILSPNERALLSFEEGDLPWRHDFHFWQLTEFQKKKPRKRDKKRAVYREALKDYPKEPEKLPSYDPTFNEHLERIFGIPIAL